MPPQHQFPHPNEFDIFNREALAAHPGIDFDSIDWNDPEDALRAIGAANGNLPMPKMASAEQVKREAKHRVINIFDDQKLLTAIMERHEATLHKRWTKKTRKQRNEILLGAWPNMAEMHRPDWHAFKTESPQQRDRGTRFRDAYMWNFINLEDLSKPRTLLLLLQSRAYQLPDAFAMADHESLHVGIVSKAIVPLFLNEYTMLFNDRKTASTYGELISWDDHEEAFHWLHTGKGTHPGNGLVILEVQERLYRFLVDCCKGILHNIAFAELLDGKYSLQPPLALPPAMVDGHASLVVLATEAPYRPPADMDLFRLEALFAAHKSSAEDRIWALREDPHYFLETVLEMKEHRQETLKDTEGRPHPVTQLGREHVFWLRIISNVVATTHLRLEVWTELHNQVKNLRYLQNKHAADILPMADLPEEYLMAILTFHHYLSQAAKGPLGALKHFAQASPGLRPYFVRTPPGNPNSTNIHIMSKNGVRKDKVTGEYIWLLQTLWDHDKDLFFLGIPNVVDELERLIQSEPAARALVSPYIADVLADLSICSEGIRQVKIYQPWASTFDALLPDREEGIKEEFAKNTRGWGLLMKATDGPRQKKIIELGTPVGRKFYYPVDKRRTKESIEAMRSAEENLDEFWQGVDLNMETLYAYDPRHARAFRSTALHQLLSKSRILERTAEWSEPVKDVEMGDLAVEKPLSELYLDLELRTERTNGSSQLDKPEAKTKTRGTTAVQTQTAEPMPPAPSKSHQTFALEPRPLKVFRTLFHTPSTAAMPGEVSWTDFLHAMVSISFQVEKLYGSVWQFTPTRLDVERSIHFHEPHPSGKLRYVVARRFGRRLHRAYGLDGGCFVRKD